MIIICVDNFNALIENKAFSDQSVKNKQEAYEKLVEMSRNDDNTARNLLDFLYHQHYYEFIGIGLSKQTDNIIPQQINFVWQLEKNNATAIFFIAEKQQKNYFKLFLRFILNEVSKLF